MNWQANASRKEGIGDVCSLPAAGDVCEPDSQQCCQVDVKRPMSCTLPSKAEGGVYKRNAAGAPGKAKPTCMAKGQDFLGETACVAEGSSCNPLENTCCQGPEKNQAWTLNDLQASSSELPRCEELLTCQLKFSERPGVRSPAYVCSKEFNPPFP